METNMSVTNIFSKLLVAGSLLAGTQLMSQTAGMSIVGTAHAGSLVEKILRTDPSLPLPGCESTKVLKKITRDFNWAERNTWNRGFEIETLGHPQQKGIDARDDQFSDVPLVPTRYCEVTAHMTNGQRYSMHYLIEAKMGFVGVGWGAEFCVHGLDPWNTFDGYCRAAHPGG